MAAAAAENRAGRRGLRGRAGRAEAARVLAVEVACRRRMLRDPAPHVGRDPAGRPWTWEADRRALAAVEAVLRELTGELLTGCTSADEEGPRLAAMPTLGGAPGPPRAEDGPSRVGPAELLADVIERTGPPSSASGVPASIRRVRGPARASARVT
jgi:hypothetical protein